VSYTAVIVIGPGVPEFASTQRPELVNAVELGAYRAQFAH
jgi:hypothetical protein